MVTLTASPTMFLSSKPFMPKSLRLRSRLQKKPLGAFGEHLYGEFDLAWLAVHGERADELELDRAVRRRLRRTGNRFERDRWVLLDVEEIGAAEMVVALGVVREQAGGIDFERKGVVGGIVFVELVIAAGLEKHAIRVAEAGMADAEDDGGVAGIDFVGVGRVREVWQAERSGEQGDRAND
jgi:hypothetical protein